MLDAIRIHTISISWYHAPSWNMYIKSWTNGFKYEQDHLVLVHLVETI